MILFFDINIILTPYNFSSISFQPGVFNFFFSFLHRAVISRVTSSRKTFIFTERLCSQSPYCSQGGILERQRLTKEEPGGGEGFWDWFVGRKSFPLYFLKSLLRNWSSAFSPQWLLSFQCFDLLTILILSPGNSKGNTLPR